MASAASRTPGAGLLKGCGRRGHPTRAQLALPFGVIAHGPDPCQQLSKQVAFLARHRTFTPLGDQPGACATASDPVPAGRGEEGLRVLSLAADLEGAKVLVPRVLGSLRLGLTLQLELVQVLGRDLPLTKSLEQMISQSRWKVLPRYLRHQWPNVSRASSSLICCCSAGSLALVSRSASRRNRSRSAS